MVLQLERWMSNRVATGKGNAMKCNSTKRDSMKRSAITKALLRAAVAVMLGGAAVLAAADQVNVYSARHYDSDEALYAEFTRETGIQVNLLQGDSDQLIERIRREGAASPADILLTVDAGRLWRAEAAELFAPVQSELLEERIPARFRHPEGLWFGFSSRLRLIFVAADSPLGDSLQRYEDLADPKYRGEICIRSSGNVYNQSLLASVLAANGPEAALAWAEGLVGNLARPPQGGDTDQVKGVAAGECSIGIANHYYYVRMLESDDPVERAQAERVRPLAPNQQDRGVHANIGGAGMLRGAPHPENAVRFLEFLASTPAQRLFAEGNYEFPVVDGVPLQSRLEVWQAVRQDALNVSELGRLNAEAVRIADRARWR